MDALRKKLGQTTTKYVHAGMSSDDLGLQLEKAKIHVLAPEEDIDRFYLGKEADESLTALKQSGTIFKRRSAPIAEMLPKNISASDFRLLQSRLLANAFTFAEKDSGLQNNTSVVLLIEWRGRRLLFVGDAEWEGKYVEGKHNGSWNVMWHQRAQHLKKPIDFLKIGHHGSVNATPWTAEEGANFEVNQILNAILPLPGAGAKPIAQAVVSTQRTKVYETIPSANLLVEIGKRVMGTRRYHQELERIRIEQGKDKIIDLFEEPPFDNYMQYEMGNDALKKPQPLRTDLEKIITGNDFVEVEIEPND
jgi:hypothetical protein